MSLLNGMNYLRWEGGIRTCQGQHLRGSAFSGPPGRSWMNVFTLTLLGLLVIGVVVVVLRTRWEHTRSGGGPGAGNGGSSTSRRVATFSEKSPSDWNRTLGIYVDSDNGSSSSEEDSPNHAPQGIHGSGAAVVESALTKSESFGSIPLEGKLQVYSSSDGRKESDAEKMYVDSPEGLSLPEGENAENDPLSDGSSESSIELLRPISTNGDSNGSSFVVLSSSGSEPCAHTSDADTGPVCALTGGQSHDGSSP